MDPLQPTPPDRIGAFDSLRFLAALVVLFSHAVPLFGAPALREIASWGLFNSKSAVALFFVLSGYVLHMSWRHSPPSPAGTLRFLIRRWFRIYPLYYLSLLLCAAVLMLAQGSLEAFRSDEVVAQVLAHDHRDVTQWLHHLLLVTPALDFSFLNPPIWTLAAEMRVAFVVPLISWLLFRLPRRAAWAVLVLGFMVLPLAAAHTISTIAVVPLFMLGATISQHLPSLAPRAGWLLLVVASVGYASSSFLQQKLALPDVARLYPAGIFSAALLVAIAQLGALRTGLTRCIPAPLANTSYGVYVLHFPLLLSACALVSRGWMDARWALGLLTLATVGLACVCYYLLEHPMIKLGRRLCALPLRPKTADKLNEVSALQASE